MRAHISHKACSAIENNLRARCWLLIKSVFVVMLTCVMGCQKGRVAQVEGTVTLNGKPLPGVKVFFYPESDGKEPLPFATGVTNEVGLYTLTLGGAQYGKPGASPGQNRVVINWPSKGHREEMDGRQAKSPTIIPLNYTAVRDTPLIVEVQAGRRQKIDLKLEE